MPRVIHAYPLVEGEPYISRSQPNVLAKLVALGANPLAPEPKQNRWPLTCRLVALLKRPEDQGIGDTLARDLEKVGAKTVAEVYTKITGRKCGCSDAQQWLNSMYPYE